MKIHQPHCPRLAFWDAGEWQAPCWCDVAPKSKPAEPELWELEPPEQHDEACSCDQCMDPPKEQKS